MYALVVYTLVVYTQIVVARSHTCMLQVAEVCVRYIIIDLILE